jgi:DNA-nicking Smr family endonuclease
LARRKKPPPHPKKFINRPLSDLADLKQDLPTEEAPPPKQAPPEPKKEDEEELFARAMSGVAPIADRREELPPEPRAGKATTVEEREEEEVMQALQDLVDGERPLSIHETDEAIEGAIEGLDPRILRKLRNGEFSVQDHLDLHGMTRDQAREQVEMFLQKAILQRKRCVLIIHGRGLGSKDRVPVLKNALGNWFTRRALKKKILAFTTAKEYDGGGGAMYVLLRKYQPNLANS